MWKEPVPLALPNKQKRESLGLAQFVRHSGANTGQSRAHSPAVFRAVPQRNLSQERCENAPILTIPSKRQKLISRHLRDTIFRRPGFFRRIYPGATPFLTRDSPRFAPV